jgi:AcrR family transcriptional regulator
MSTDTQTHFARLPKRARGKQRVAALLEAAGVVFAEKGYEAATMTEIAARAGAPIGSLYQFFPVKEVIADTLVQNYAAMLASDLTVLEENATGMDAKTLIAGLFGLLRAHPRERAAALPIAEARMDERTRRVTFRHMLRKRVAAILRARDTTLNVDSAREMALVLLQLMKAANSLSDEEGLTGRSAALRDLQSLAAHFLDQHRAQA